LYSCERFLWVKNPFVCPTQNHRSKIDIGRGHFHMSYGAAVMGEVEFQWFSRLARKVFFLNAIPVDCLTTTSRVFLTFFCLVYWLDFSCFNLQGIDAFYFPCMDILSINILCIPLYPISAGTNGGTNTLAQSRVTLPFQPLALCFNHVNYYVDMPAVSKCINT
jgi:hypothetical protein